MSRSENMLIFFMLAFGIASVLFLLSNADVIQFESGRASVGITGLVSGEFGTQEETFSAEPVLNQPPVFNGGSLSTPADTQLTIDLSQQFSDPENDALTFIATSEDVIEVGIDGSIATFTPAPGFQGERTLTIIATDGVNVLRQQVKLTVGDASTAVEPAVPVSEQEPAASEPAVPEAPVEEAQPFEQPVTTENQTVPAEAPQNESGFGTQEFTAAVALSGCATINQSSELTQNVASIGTCIIFNNDNITLDCDGFVITYDLAGDSDIAGIDAAHRRNITIRDCIVQKNTTNGSGMSTINFTNTSDSFIINNTLLTNGSSSFRAIFLQNLSSNNLVSNNTIRNNASGSTVYGLEIKNTTMNVIAGNTIVTNCSSSCYGISQVLEASNETTYQFNVITAGNRFGSSSGMLITAANGLVILDNNITTVRGGTFSDTNRGIEVPSSGSNATISRNVIRTNGGSSNIGIYFIGDDANITGNDARSNGTSGSNFGILISGARIRVEHNRIVTGGQDDNAGIRMLGSNATIANNSVNTTGRRFNDGLDVSSMTDARIENNTIITRGNQSGHDGISLSSSSRNVFQGNRINVTTAPGAINNTHGVVFSSSHNNTFRLTNISTTGINSFGVSLSSTMDNTFNATVFMDVPHWITSSSSAFATFENTTFANTSGSINILGQFLINGTQNVTGARLVIGPNGAFLNAALLPFLNRSAIITLNNLTAANAQPTVDLEDDGTFVRCAADRCTRLSYTGGTLRFNVTGFTNYSSIKVEVELTKTDNPDPVNASEFLNYTILVNVTSGSASNVSLTDFYPSQVIFQSAQPTPEPGTNNTFIVGNLTENQSFSVNVTVLVRNLSDDTVLNNTANISFVNSTGDNVSLTVSELTTAEATDVGCPLTINTSTTLTQSITGTGTCVTFGASNTVLDCAGNTITYSTMGANDSYGVVAGNRQNITVQNCNIRKGNVNGVRGYGITLFNTSVARLENNTITTNGTNENDGIHVSPGSGPTGRVELVRNANDLNNPFCTNPSNVNFCKTCYFPVIGVACTTLGLSGCQDGEGFKTQDIVSFNLTSIPTGGRVQVIGGEVVRCSMNNNLFLSFYARNTCGALRSANIPGSFFVVGENNLTCSVSGSGGDEDNGFKLAAFSYELPSPVQGVLIINNTVVSDGGNLSHGIFMAASNSTIRANTVLTTGEERGHAIFLEFSSGSNNVSDNILTTQASGGNALHAFAATMNNFTNNTVVSAARASAHLEEALNNTFGLSFLPTSTSLFVSEPNGSINYTETINFSNTTNIADVVRVGFNFTQVNATGGFGQQLNRSALLTFIGLPADGVLAVFDAEDDGTFDDCSAPRCANTSYNATGGVLTYNVSSFTTYAAEEISACAVLDLDTFTNQSNATFRLRNNVSANGDCYSIVEENITLDCAGFTIRGTGTGFGVFSNNTRNVLVENCTIINFDGSIVFVGVNNSIIRNNSGINSTSSSFQINSSQNVTVSGNNVTIRNVLSTVLGAIHIPDSTGITVINNTAATNSSTIFLSSARNSVVADNNATSGGGVGIQLTSAHNNTIARNRAVGPNGGIAIRVENSHNNTIDGNNATSNNVGISVSGTGSLDENATCRANRLYNNSVVATSTGTAISIITCIAGFIIDNNGTALGSGNGIDLTDSSYHVLVDNNGTSFSGNGIECGGTLGVATAGFGSQATELTGGACNSNRLENNNGTSIGGTGILLTRASNNTLSNNTGVSQNRTGIALIGGNDNTLENNNGTSQRLHGIALDVLVELGFGDSFAIEAFNGEWNSLGEEHFSPQPAPGYRYTTKTLEMPAGTTRVRLTHDGGTDTAHIDAVLLDGNAPASARDLLTGENLPLTKFSAADYDIIDAHARPVELEWEEPGTELAVSAVEEDLVGVPTVWPSGGFARYVLGAEQVFEYRVVPYSSHPSGTVYAALRVDEDALLLDLDRTTDNTLDYGGDWAQLRVSSDAGMSSFTISASETEWGTSAYEYTNKVSWQHKTYSFRIPLQELGLSAGDEMRFQIAYYGTEAGAGTLIACVNNTLRNNIGLSIHGFGINMSRCNNNTLINNTAISLNNTAFHMRKSSNNILINNTAVANNGTALHAINGSNNTFANTSLQAVSGDALFIEGGLTTFISSGNFCDFESPCTGGEVCNNDSNVCVNPNENLTIAGCINTTFDNSRIASASAVAVRLNDCQNSTFRNNQGRGIVAILFANSNNTILTNNTLSVSDGVAVHLGTSAGNTFSRTTLLSNATWLFSDGTVSAITFLNTTFDAVLGSINTLPSVSLPSSVNVSQQTLNITQNRAFLNSSKHSFLNVTSIVTLRNLSFGNPQPLVDFNDTGNFVNCNASQCTRLSFANGTFVFNVTTFTTYSSEEGGVNITLTKTDNPDPVNTGGGLNYTITVTVVASNASNITLTDTYPPQVVFNTAQPAPLAGTNNTFIIGNLTGGQSFTVNITVNVASGIANGTVINNTANISFHNQTGTLLNQSVTESTTVLSEAAVQFNVSNITLTKLDNPDPVNSSSILNYTIVINVTADSPANVTLTDIYPPQVIFLSAQPSPLAGTNNTFIIGNLTNGTVVLVNISVLVLNVSNGTVINNTANISFHNQTGNVIMINATQSTTVLNVTIVPLFNFSNISVSKIDSPDPVNSSANLTYTINVTSTGNGTAYNVTVNDTYPPQVIFLTAQPTPVTGTNNTFVIGNLTPGTSILINITTLTFNLTNGTVINNSVNVTFQNETSGLFSAIDIENTTVTNITIVPLLNFSNISVSKSDNPDPVENNTQLNYAITITSTGNGTAFNVTLIETYPPQVVFNTAQPAPSSGNTTFILGNLTAGTFVIVNITVNVTQVTNGTIINNTVNVTFQNESGGLFSITDSESTIVENVSAVPSPTPSQGGSGGRGGFGGVQRPSPEAPRVVTGACMESWACEVWSSCADGAQVRTCVDLSQCNTTAYLPITRRACEMPVQLPEQVILPVEESVPDLPLEPPATPEGLPWKWITAVLIILMCIVLLVATVRAWPQHPAQQRLPPTPEMRRPHASQRVPRSSKGFYARLDGRDRELDDTENYKLSKLQQSTYVPIQKRSKISKEAKDFYQGLKKYDDELDKLEAALQKKLKKR